MHEIVDENHNLYFDLFNIRNELLFDLNKFHLFNQRSQPVASLLNNLFSVLWFAGVGFNNIKLYIALCYYYVFIT